MQEPDRRIVPTVSRVCGDAIIELVYDPEELRTALIVGRDGKWRKTDAFDTSRDERLVPYAATNNLIAHECVMLPSEPVSFGGKETLLRDIEGYLHRYVDVSPLFEKIAAHYVLLTWVYDAFNEIPLLRLQGDYGSGKTRALIALGSIAYKGFFASGASTVSPIFHTIDRFGGTLILDEADLRFSDKTADLVKILNNATVRGLPILRTLSNRNREFNPAAFNVYGPKIVAMRGAFRDPALESRFLTERMGTRLLRPDIPIQLPASLKVEALQLRNRLLDFRLKHLAEIKTDTTRILSGIDPRLNQTAVSLLSLIDDAKVRDEIAGMLRERQAAITIARSRSVETRAFKAITEAFGESNRASVPLSEITKRVNDLQDELDEPVSARKLGRLLRALSIDVRKSHGVMIVPRGALKSRGMQNL